MEDTLKRWGSEKTAAYLSTAVAANERDPRRAKLFRHMAKSAEDQAAIMARELKHAPTFTPSLRARITAGLLRVLPPRAMRHVLSASRAREEGDGPGRIRVEVELGARNGGGIRCATLVLNRAD